MEQPELFAHRDYSFVYDHASGHKNKWRQQWVDVYDPEGFCLIHVESETYGQHPRRVDLIEIAKTAWLLRNVRPFGDNYQTALASVTYLTDSEM